ncbi:MAG: methylmalonyl-CoA mutase family protein, partial [Alphaproteobacteria bacterium]|nr:methylmalonyl-CoA mutase family protein [Alphaproteobacteria bacterium]
MSETASTKITSVKRPASRAHKSQSKIRFVTATSLFDGHDAAINIMRRILQSSGVEVVHLGHNRSVDEVVTAAIQEDVQAIAVSSYQGGHLEYFKYAIDLLHERGAGRIKLFGGGGGVIVKEEIDELQAYGVERIYSPEDGQRMGLQGMINDMITRANFDPSDDGAVDPATLCNPTWRPLARFLTRLENGQVEEKIRSALSGAAGARPMPVLGITGTGGSGKSSLSDELIRRFRLDSETFRIAILAIDPSKRKSGGALLGDRIRMNAINTPHIYMRSFATRNSESEVPGFLPGAVDACRGAGFDLVIVETPGIGQGDAAIADLADVSLYVMTPEFGSASQLEKIDMLDFADLVAINKFDRKGAEDALRDVRKQVQRNRGAFDRPLDVMPVYGTVAARFQDDGVTQLYLGLRDLLLEKGFRLPPSRFAPNGAHVSSARPPILPPARQRYLAEIATEVRAYHQKVANEVTLAREIQQLKGTQRMLSAVGGDPASLVPLIAEREGRQDPGARTLVETWPEIKKSYSGDDYVVKVRGKESRTRQVSTSLSGTQVRKVALPRYEDHGELLRWLLSENLPGVFPYTAGVFRFKREGEDPTRMFAGEGDPFRTNERFKFLSKDSEAKRLSTAFDSVTLYGFDPAERPDIYGKIGNSGVSIATLEDMKVLYSGFDLCNPTTSVS